MSKTVGVIVGSLSASSINRRVVGAIRAAAPADLSFVEIDVSDTPFYNPDVDGEAPPEAWTKVREAVKSVDAVLFVTPEYNRSVPAIMKNVLDILSRPYGQGALAGKVTAVVSASLGASGGMAAHLELKKILGALGTAQLPGPEIYLGGVNDAWFAEDGSAANEGTRKFLAGFAQGFSDWIGKHV